MKYQQRQPIVPEKTADGITLVDWYDTNDQENPQNWSTVKKGVVVSQIYLYTLAVYMG
jgi:DHA1 family multidrug resistance protein-like MFS transporter